MESMGYLYKTVQEKCKDAEHLLKMQNQCSNYILSQDGQKLFKDEWKGSLDATEAVMALEKNINQALLDLYILGSALTALPSLTLWTAVCLDDEVKLVKISDHLN